MAELNEEQIERYSRQLLLPGWGTREQVALAASHVAVSARAEAAALYLAGAGVGRLSLLFPEDDELAERIRALNPNVEVSRWEKSLPPPEQALLLDGEEPPAILSKNFSRCEATLSAQALAAATLLRSLSRLRA